MFLLGDTEGGEAAVASLLEEFRDSHEKALRQLPGRGGRPWCGPGRKRPPFRRGFGRRWRGPGHRRQGAGNAAQGDGLCGLRLGGGRARLFGVSGSCHRDLHCPRLQQTRARCEGTASPLSLHPSLLVRRPRRLPRGVWLWCVPRHRSPMRDGASRQRSDRACIEAHLRTCACAGAPLLVKHKGVGIARPARLPVGNDVRCPVGEIRRRSIELARLGHLGLILLRHGCDAQHRGGGERQQWCTLLRTRMVRPWT